MGDVGKMADQVYAAQAADVQFATFLDLLPAQSDAVALQGTDGRRALTYRQLVDFACSLDLARFGVHIRSHGAAEESDRLCVVIPNGPEAAVCFVSMSQYCSYAPLNPNLTAGELEFEFLDLPAKAVVVQAGAGNETVLQVARGLQKPVLELVRSEQEVGIFSLRWHAASSVQLPAVSQRRRAQRQDIALVLHTSGTTKKPKIVPLTHENICVGASCIASTLKLKPDDVNMNMMPLYHIHGLSINVLATLLAGACLVATPGFDMEAVLSWLALPAAVPNWYSAVPTMHQLLAEQAKLASERASLTHRLRLIRNCSAALPTWLSSHMEEIFQLNVMPTYAMTESMPICSNPRDDRRPGPPLRRLSSVGFAAGPDVRVLSLEGKQLDKDCEGEVCVKGACVTAGYEYRSHMGEGMNPNVEAFHADGFLRTGDKGYVDGDGYLTLVGRFKEIINRAGEKLSPLAIEEILQQHSAVSRLIAFAMPHETFGEVAGAAVVLQPNATLALQDLRAFGLKQGLSPQFLPELIIFMDSIPVGPTGKPARINLAGPQKCRYTMQPLRVGDDKVLWRVNASGSVVPLGNVPSLGDVAAASPSDAALPSDAAPPGDLQSQGPPESTKVVPPGRLAEVRQALVGVICEQLGTRGNDDFVLEAKMNELGFDSVRIVGLRRALRDVFNFDEPLHTMLRKRVRELADMLAAKNCLPACVSLPGVDLSTSQLSFGESLASDASVGAFTVIEPGAKIGRGAVISSHCFVESGASVGEGCHIGRFTVIGAQAVLGPGTVVGSHCTIAGSGTVQIGANTRIESHCRITATAPWKTVLGERNELHAQVVLGSPPQDFNRMLIAGGLLIGNDNVFREGVSIDAARGWPTQNGEQVPGNTRVGSNCYIMRNAHVAHDCLLEDRVVLTMNVQLAGYVRVMHHSNIGVGAVVHQFSTVGPFCMVGMGTAVTRDPLPFTMYLSRLGLPSEGSVTVNRVGLARGLKLSDEHIDALEVFYRRQFCPTKGPLAGQVAVERWFTKDFQAFDHHRASQQQKRQLGDLL